MNSFGDFFLEDEPRAAFLAALAPFLTTPQRRRLGPDMFGNVYGQFLAKVGRQAMSGQLNPMNLPKFADFTRGQDFNRNFQDMPRWQRGGEQQFNPRTRFLFGF